MKGQSEGLQPQPMKSRRIRRPYQVAQIGGIMYIEGLYDRMLPFMQNGMGEISCLCVREMKSIEEVTAWQRKLQKDIMERSPHHIPAIFHIEGLCGSFTQGSTSIPSGVSRGSSFDVELEEKQGEMERSLCGRNIRRYTIACGDEKIGESFPWMNRTVR